ncbi:MAG TPA: DUF1566 domain-containing protein [bacterium]|nr:DUF1566 domain-containing protein [bacterium]
MFERTKIIFLLVVTILLMTAVSCDQGSGKKSEEPDSISVDDSDTELETETKTSHGFPPNVQRWPLVGTGQYQCFDHEKQIPCPSIGEPFYGQDGNHQIGVRSYGVNDDATVTDILTGIVWQQGFKTDVSWYEAKSYCDNLSLAGFSWRLPTTHELKSIVDYGASKPSINTTAFPDTPSDWFWAAPVRHNQFGTTETAWIISFIDGQVEYTARNNFYNVRCVKID